MITKMLRPNWAFEKDAIVADVKWMIGASGAVQTVTVPPVGNAWKSITRNSAGNYTLTLTRAYTDLIKASVDIAVMPFQSGTNDTFGVRLFSYVPKNGFPAWTASLAYGLNPSGVSPSSPNFRYYITPTGASASGTQTWMLTTAGTSGGSEPSWPASPTPGVTTQADSGATWTYAGPSVTQGGLAAQKGMNLTFITFTVTQSGGHNIETATDLPSGSELSVSLSLRGSALKNP